MENLNKIEKILEKNVITFMNKTEDGVLIGFVPKEAYFKNNEYSQGHYAGKDLESALDNFIEGEEMS